MAMTASLSVGFFVVQDKCGSAVLISGMVTYIAAYRDMKCGSVVLISGMVAYIAAYYYKGSSQVWPTTSRLVASWGGRSVVIGVDAHSYYLGCLEHGEMVIDSLRMIGVVISHFLEYLMSLVSAHGCASVDLTPLRWSHQLTR